MSLEKISKFISLVLRHHPEALGISLDEHGWANVDELIAGLAQKQHFDMAMLEEIVSSDRKGRYSFNEDKSLIRANQGHSIPVDVELSEAVPPAVLYHGTATRFVSAINEMGLIPKSRLYVHLSADLETARMVGARHGKPCVYQVDAAAMHADGQAFYLSVNGVWLTKEVAPKYLTLL